MISHVGFTGTQLGMTKKQKETLQREFLSLDYAHLGWWLHHGDCVGADEQAHAMAKAYGGYIWIHPPSNGSKRAFCSYEPARDKIVPPKPYLERNKDIVRVAQRMIATPDGPERVRSGTWSTIRYAKKLEKDLIIIMPDGSIL